MHIGGRGCISHYRASDHASIVKRDSIPRISYEDRRIIALRLRENASFGEIGKELGRDRTTIAKEVKKYSYHKKSGRPGYPYNPCKFRVNCKAKGSIYDPADAHEMAHKTISESKTGILSNEGDIARINGIISPLVRNGQSLHQVYLDHVDIRIGHPYHKCNR